MKIEINQLKLNEESNRLQRKDCEYTLSEYVDKLNWLPSGDDTLLDVGSRNGDILFDYILPTIPKTFSRIIGTDSSAAMISRATEKYSHPKMAFEQLDITNRSDVDKMLTKFGPFRHITSFFDLHRIQNQEICFKNIFDLLMPNGDILITMCQHHPLYENIREMMGAENWENYRDEMAESTSPYFDSLDPVKMLREVLETAGFQDVGVTLNDRQFQFQDQNFTDSMIPVVPMLNNVPEVRRKEFLLTYVNKITTPNKTNKTQNGSNIILPYRMLTAYAKKGSGTDCPKNHTNNSKQTPKIEVAMHKAKGYHETNSMQRKDALDTIMEYKHIFKWSTEGDAKLLDIGSGSGDVTFEYILPLMPKDSQLIASDISLEMIAYATANFKHKNLKFIKLDILDRCNTEAVLKNYGNFEIITSFCALHWALDQDAVMKNFYKLTRPGGEVLFTICQHHPLYEHYADMMKLPKWSPYKDDMTKSTSPYFHKEHPEDMLIGFLKRAGFQDIHVELKTRLHPFKAQVFLDSTDPVAPFLENISETLKQEFLKIYIDKVMSMGLPPPHKPNKERNDGITMIPFRMLLAHAKRPV